MGKCILIFFILILPLFIKGQSYDTVRALKTSLFNSYDKTIRPSSDHSYSTLVYVDLVLVGINELDEVSEKLVTTGYVYIAWYDDKLVWDPASHEDLQYMYIPQNEIWKPDIQLKNGFQEFKRMGGDFMYAELSYDGYVVWTPFKTFETKCSIAITYFPFDTQTCDITFIMWSMDILDVNLTEWAGNVDLYSLESNGEWDVVSSQASSNADATEAEVTFSLTLKRKPLNLLLNLIIPLILLTVLDIFTFMIPVDSGEKIGFCMTVFLSFAVFLTIVSDRLPGSSDGLSLLGAYLLTMLTQGCIIIVMTTVQLRLYYRNAEIPVPKSLQLMSKSAQILQCRIRPKFTCKRKRTKENKVIPCDKNDECDLSTEDVPLQKSWKEVVEAIDFFMFLLTATNLFISTTIICSLAISGDS